MSNTFVTTFSIEHLDIYGKRFLDSYKRFVKNDLVLYAEDFLYESALDFNETIPDHAVFKSHVLDLISKETNKKEIARLKKALRWSYKSFAIIHALENATTKYVTWIDADVEVRSNVPDNICQTLCQGRLLYAFKQRIKNEEHIESGFVIFNTEHPHINQIINGYKRGYHFKQVLELPKPWDGFWLAHLLKNPDLRKCCLLTTPFADVSRYFTHHVGKEKFVDTGFDKYSGRKNLTF